MMKKVFFGVLALSMLISGCGNAGKTAYNKESDAFRIVSYNVGAFGKYMDSSIPMIADMMKEVGADVVTLNELDSCNRRHEINQVATLADKLGWQWSFGRAMPYAGGAYGNGVILPKKAKILNEYVIALPKGAGSEPPTVAVVETNEYVIGAVHLDYADEDAAVGQVKVINHWMSEHFMNISKPVFLCGDMNAVPDSKVIAALLKDWDMLSANELSFSSTEPDRCIDYIFHYKASAPVSKISAHTLTTFRTGDVKKTSDHLPIYVDVRF
jgi:endonuclease/exonuclease/phosphatase family metal-dependent hydrolase